MNKFDELLDDVIFKAKTAADVAGKKTAEVVEVSKLKYQAKQISWEIEKTYAKLGALVYEARKSDESFEDVIVLAVEELDGLNARLDELEEKIAETKKQPTVTQEYRAKAAAKTAADQVVDIGDEVTAEPVKAEEPAEEKNQESTSEE